MTTAASIVLAERIRHIALSPTMRGTIEAERLRQYTMFWVGGFRALMVEGDPAAGKTSFVEQIHARLNVPLHKVPCGPLVALLI